MRLLMAKIVLIAALTLSLGACTASRQASMPLSSTDSLGVIREVSEVTRANFALSRDGRFEESFQRFTRNCTGAADGKLILSWEDHRTRVVLPFLARLDSITFTLGDFVVTPLAREAAVVVGKYAFSAVRGEQHLSHPSTAFTWVFAKRSDRWEIIHWHTSNP